ncbi:MAG: hypothetical protein QXY70_03270 [Nanopusillaceae archaeon]
MIKNIKEIYEYSSDFDIPPTDVFLIALNTCGARSELNFLRVRSYIIPRFVNTKFYLMICLNTTNSPFYLKDSQIYLNDEFVGKLIKLEEDPAELCYFRKKNRVLVLNTNDRTSCIGKCAFCGSLFQKPRYNLKIIKFKELLSFFENIEKISGTKFSKLESINLCTGLFETEKKLVRHILDIYSAAKTLGFDGEIAYIGTQIRSKKSLNKISTKIPKFYYLFALETLEKKNLIDRRKRICNSYYLDNVIRFLKKLKKYNFQISILYVLGLDSLPVIEEAFYKIKKYLTRFPVINLFQAYHPIHENLRHPQARKLDYFLKARKVFEKIFSSTDMRPNLWENYRGLWYTTFGKEEIRKYAYFQTFIRGY